VSIANIPAAARHAHLTVETVRSDAAFDALEREWSELAAASEVSVFQTHEWLRSWWTYFAGERSLWILLFRSGDVLAGIAPLCVEEVRLFGVVVARHVQFIGRELSDYGDILLRPGHEEEVLDAFSHHLGETSDRWDVLDLDDVSERSGVVRLFPAALARRGITLYEQPGPVCPYVTLPGRADALVQELGATSRYNFRRKFRNLQAQFTTEIELIRRPEDDLPRAVSEFSLIHGERWKSLGYPSAFDNAQHRAFHVEIARKFAARDWLRMFFLTADGVPVAVTFCFNYRERIYMYQSNVHGSEAVMKCSPGFLIRSVAMAEGITEGMRVFDFLRGNEEYKYREWGAVDSRNWLLRVRSPRPGRTVRFALFLVREFAAKTRRRVLWEYYEFRRMRIVQHPSPGALLRYVGEKVSALSRLGVRFIARYLHGSRDGGEP
jgi:CelD/BcsL family acetyltransferase involved in cellulose biosynthesis